MLHVVEPGIYLLNADVLSSPTQECELLSIAEVETSIIYKQETNQIGKKDEPSKSISTTTRKKTIMMKQKLENNKLVIQVVLETNESVEVKTTRY